MAPHEILEVVLSHGTAGAHASLLVTVVVGAQASVVVQPSLAGARRASVVAVAATRTGDESLKKRWFFRTTRSETPIILKPARGQLEDLLRHDGRDSDLDPLGARLISRDMPTGHHPLSLPAHRSCHLGPCADLSRLPECGVSAVGRIAEHPPDRRTVPARLPCRRTNPLLTQPAGESRNRLVLFDVAPKQLANHHSFSFDDVVARFGLLTLAHIAIAVGGTGEDCWGARTRSVQLATACSLDDLRTLILGDHSLELQEELVLRRLGLRRLEEANLAAHPRELLDEQRLVGVATGEPIGRVAQHHRDLDLRCKVPETLQPRPNQRSTRVPLILEYPLRRHLPPRCGSVSAQRRCLAGNGLLLFLSR